MKYDYFQEEKLKYDEIEIPDELLLMVRQTVAADRRKKATAWRARIIKTAGSVAAILFLCLTIGVNSSYAFAETVVKIPVVKSVAKAVIVRSYKADIIALDEQSSKQPEDTPDVEQMPEETVPTVSDNDVISEEETPEQQVPAEPEEVLEGFEAWKAEMTPEKFKEVTELYASDMEERYADTPEKLRTILLAEEAEKDVFLYGYHENGKLTGAALLVKDTYQYFDWNYMNSTKKLPEISFTDVNDDGEEEIAIFLYNGEPQMKAVSKEDIKAPETSESAGTSENTISSQEGTDGSDTQNMTSAEDAKETASEDDKPSVSGNDTGESSEPKETPEQQAGEIWIVSLKEENWFASVLSIDDYESQILHQLKAEYDETSNTVQLYLMEEPFGEPVEISFEEQDKPTYETINLAPEREFVTENGFFLNFDIEAVFSGADSGKVQIPLNLNLKAKIHLEDSSLMVENIEGRSE